MVLSDQVGSGRMEFIEERDRSGCVVRRYVKGKLLGKGGFARCYEATDVETKEEFAVKVISKATLSKPKTRQKLKTEIKIHRSIEHKHIVRFHKYFEDENNVYILLELCRGKTILDLSAARGRFTETEASYFVHECLLALRYMHALGIIHRDLKLGNIMLSGNMDVKIGDFGLAARLYFAGEKRRTLCGTPNYIAPEILASGHGHSLEVDVWTIGVILYAMLVGKPPFQTADVNTTYGKIKRCSYSFPHDVNISREGRDLIGRILQVSPEGRPTVEQIMEDPWFKLYPPRKLAPLSLFKPGSTAYARQQDRIIEESRRKRSGADILEAPQATVKPPARSGRVPLGRIDPNQHQAPAAVKKHRSSSAIVRHPAQSRQSPSPLRGNVRPMLSTTSRGRADKPDIPTNPGIAPHRFWSADSRAHSNSLSPPIHSSPMAPLNPPALAEFVGVNGSSRSRTPLHTDEEDAKNLTTVRDKLEQTIAFNDKQASREVSIHSDSDAGCKAGSLKLSAARLRSQPASPPSEQPLEGPSVWVTEYADFTAKYGLAYRFSNGQIGVHFNDNTKMVYTPPTADVWYIVRQKSGPLQGTDHVTHCRVGNHPEELNKKVTLIKYFSSYISRAKTKPPKDGQQEVVVCSKAPAEKSNPSEIVYVRKWLKTSDATIFRLSNRKVQVCFQDSTEIILSSEARLVTYTNQDGQRNTFSLSRMSSSAQPDIASRLRYTKDIIGRLIH
eukprot:gene15536-23708_t